MKKRERSFENREPYNQSVPRESLWYFSEELVNASSRILQEKEMEEAAMNYKRLIQERNHQLISRSAQRNTFKRTFVVDWEMSDVL